MDQELGSRCMWKEIIQYDSPSNYWGVKCTVLKLYKNRGDKLF